MVETDSFSNFNWKYMDKLNFDVWDLSGRLPHLWAHQMNRANGIVFVISQKEADLDDEYLPNVIKAILNLTVNYFNVPITFIVNQYTGHANKTKLDKAWFTSEVFSVADKKKDDFSVHELNLKELSGLA